MTSRLVLGSGAVGRAVIDRLDGAVTVVTESGGGAEPIRAAGHTVHTGDPTDVATLETIERPSTVVITGEDPARNCRSAAAAREAFPGAVLVAYEGMAATPEQRASLEDRTDRVVDGPTALSEWLRGMTTGSSGDRPFKLRQALAEIDGRLAVVAHDNPDPDAIASAVALCEMAASVGVEADPCYYGEISHQENRAMVTQLDLDLIRFEPSDSLEAYDGFALVDHARPGVNDQLPSELHVDVVIDHHPPRGPVPAAFYDCRVDAGATSSVLAQYLRAWDLEPTTATASALLFGIQVDTDDFSRGVAPVDFEAAASLWSIADHGTLERITRPTVEGETLDAIARAIKSRREFGSVVVANAGELPSRDVLPQAADQLLAMEGIRTTLVFGFIEELVYLSARSRAGDIDLGETLRDAFDPIGSGGGHADMAGAQLEIGVLGDLEDEEASLEDVVEEVVTDRFFEAIRTRPGTPVEAYRETSEWLFGSSE